MTSAPCGQRELSSDNFLRRGLDTSKRKRPPKRSSGSPSHILADLRIPLPRITVKSLARDFAPIRRADFLCPERGKEMQQHISTTPFGRRALTLAHVASQTAAKARPAEKA